VPIFNGNFFITGIEEAFKQIIILFLCFFKNNYLIISFITDTFNL